MYIYCITNLINGKKYVGQRKKTVEKSKSYYGSGVYIKRSIKKYGKDNFKKEILEVVDGDSILLLSERERFWIKTLDTMHPNGYNLTEGGDNGYSLSDEAKQKISKTHKGKIISEETRMKISKSQLGRVSSNKGIKLSDDVKLKISNKLKGRKLDESTKDKIRLKLLNMSDETKDKIRVGHFKKINKINKDTGIVEKTYNSISEASINNNINYNEISKCLIGYRKCIGNYTWEYVDSKNVPNYNLRLKRNPRAYTELVEKSVDKLKVQVCQIDKNTSNVINIYNSIKEASENTNIHRSDISMCIRGKRKTSGGYVWKKFSDMKVDTQIIE